MGAKSKTGSPRDALDLNLLQALDVLLDEGNVTRAAERLGITQSAMSHRLRRLRELLGDPVLVPGRGHLVPSDAARQLGAAVRRALDDLRTALRSTTAFEPATSRRSFVVVTSDFAEFDVLPRVLEYLSQHAPHVGSVMREPWPGVTEALERGEVDLVVGPPLPPVAGLVQRKIAEEGFATVVRRGHPIAKRRLDLDVFMQLRHLLITPTYAAGPSVIETALAEHNFAGQIAMRVPHFIGAPFIVARSDLVLTAPRSLLRHAAELLPLRLFEPPLPLPPSRTFMTWHQRGDGDPALAWLRDLTARCTAAALA